MSFIKTKDQLPPEGKYVIGRHNRGTWIDSDDQENVNVVIVKLIKGLTEEDRQKMKDGLLPDLDVECWNGSDGNHTVKESSLYSREDVGGNNLVPYAWSCFGPDNFFGQVIYEWCEIPK